MKIIITGTRTYNHYEFVREQLDLTLDALPKETKPMILIGDNKGIAALGKRYAIEKNIPIIEFTPEWGRLGNRAGGINNVRMTKHADALICFWDGRSKDVKTILSIAKKQELLITTLNI